MVLRDGTTKGFTDLDQDITVGGVLYRSNVGLSVGAMRFSNKLETEKTQLRGVFSSATGGVTEAAVRLGLYNEAIVDIFLARWDTSVLVVPKKRGVLSNMVPQGSGYLAEVRSLAYLLQKRLIVDEVTFDCTAELGDADCTVSAGSGTDGVITTWLTSSSFIAAGFAPPVNPIEGGRIILVGSDFDWFVNKVKTYDSGTDTFTLWKSYPGNFDDLAGWDFTVFLGCDKTPTMCKDIYNNFINYRGFHMVPDKDENALPVVNMTPDGSGYISGNGEDD